MADSKQVHIETSVLLQIIKRSREQGTDYAYGMISGHTKKDTKTGTTILQVTRGIPISEHNSNVSDTTHPESFEGQSCGLYSSCPIDDNNESLIELAQGLAAHQVQNPDSVLILYNPFLSQRGIFTFRVVRLTDKYLQLENNGKFTVEKCQELDINPTELFEPVPYFIHHPTLVQAYLFDLFQNPKTRNIISSHRDLLDPSPTIVTNQLLDKLLGKGTSQHQQALFDQYANALERHHREVLYIQKQKNEYQRRLEEAKADNLRRQRNRLAPHPLPDQPQHAEPSLREIQLYSVRINNVANDLLTLTELAQLKQQVLKRIITQEGQMVIE